MTDLTNTPNARATRGEARRSPSRSPEAHQPAGGVQGEGNGPDLMALLRESLTQPGRLSEAYSLFHAYSFGNALWVAAQLIERGEPLAPVASFHRWRELGRVVKKGSKALCMTMPVTVKGTADKAQGNAEAQQAEPGTETTEGRRVLFVVRRNWFALHHTEPLDGAEPQAIAQASPEWKAERALVALGITREAFECGNGNVQGYAKPEPRRIAVSPLAVNPAKTLFHEVAHCLLHSAQARMQDTAELTRSLAEVEAESVAYLCCAVLALPGLEEARGYVQDWLDGSGRDADAIADHHARRVFGAVDAILKAGKPATVEAAD